MLTMLSKMRPAYFYNIIYALQNRDSRHRGSGTSENRAIPVPAPRLRCASVPLRYLPSARAGLGKTALQRRGDVRTGTLRVTGAAPSQCVGGKTPRGGLPFRTLGISPLAAKLGPG